MTEQPHCDHECVCMGYVQRNEMFENNPCTKPVCEYDTRRSRPATAPAICDLAEVKITGNGGHWVMCKKVVGSCEWICNHQQCPKQQEQAP